MKNEHLKRQIANLMADKFRSDNGLRYLGWGYLSAINQSLPILEFSSFGKFEDDYTVDYYIMVRSQLYDMKTTPLIQANNEGLNEHDAFHYVTGIKATPEGEWRLFRLHELKLINNSLSGLDAYMMSNRNRHYWPGKPNYLYSDPTINLDMFTSIKSFINSIVRSATSQSYNDFSFNPIISTSVHK